jgi:anti-sigma B factor antagonist
MFNTSSETVLQLEGRFDAHAVHDFRRAATHVEGDLSLDLSRVEFIDSSGLAALVSLHQRQRQRGRFLRLLNPQDAVRLILEVTRVDQELPIETTPPQRLAARRG